MIHHEPQPRPATPLLPRLDDFLERAQTPVNVEREPLVGNDQQQTAADFEGIAHLLEPAAQIRHVLDDVCSHDEVQWRLPADQLDERLLGPDEVDFLDAIDVRVIPRVLLAQIIRGTMIDVIHFGLVTPYHGPAQWSNFHTAEA